MTMLNRKETTRSINTLSQAIGFDKVFPRQSSSVAFRTFLVASALMAPPAIHADVPCLLCGQATPVQASITPLITGITVTDNVVTLLGQGLTGATAVRFGGQPATYFTVPSGSR